MRQPSTTAVDRLADHLATISDARPSLGVVPGSCLGAFGDQLERSFRFEDLRGMPLSRVPRP